MLLRIVDVPAKDAADEDKIKLVLKRGKDEYSFSTASFSSPFTDSFCRSLDRYYQEYLHNAATMQKEAGLPEKLLKLGAYLGDELLGEEHQLLKLIDYIEKQGYSHLDVQIESESIDFLSLCWESLILHDSKYVLSSAVKGFVRQFPACKNHPELFYDLHVEQAPSEGLSGLLPSSENGSRGSNEINAPLRILYVLSRPATIDLPFYSSECLGASFRAVAFGGAYEIELIEFNNLSDLRKRLSDANHPVHIVHYDGPVLLGKDVAQFFLSDGSTHPAMVDAAELAKSLVENNIGALFIDARAWLAEDDGVPTDKGLALVARSCQEHGLGNVVGLTRASDPWTSLRCFENVYLQVAKGLALAEAVVEARKSLQSQVENERFTPYPVIFHTWPLLVHYGVQSIRFFRKPCIMNSNKSLPAGKNLFGFTTGLLYPNAETTNGTTVARLATWIARHGKVDCKLIALTGEGGAGKTGLAHDLSLYLSQKDIIDHAFYFDFSEYSYSTDDIKRMVAPVINVQVDRNEAIEEKLKELRCCFVLDNFKAWSKEALLEEVLSLGHTVVTIQREPMTPPALPLLVHVQVTPLQVAEQKIIAANRLKQCDLVQEVFKRAESPTSDEALLTWENLLNAMDGNPWLLNKAVPLLKFYNMEDLQGLLRKNVTGTTEQDSKVEKFYEWRWSTLPYLERILLALSARTSGLLLEMLIIAADGKEQSSSGQKLHSLLGGSYTSISNIVDGWEASGFISRIPQGRMIDPRLGKFLEDNPQVQELPDRDNIEIAFNQVVCEGLRILSEHLVKQPNPLLTNSLLSNRRQWAKCLEKLWFSEDYLRFINTKSAFERLLTQVGLDRERNEWSYDLLCRSNLEKYLPGKDLDAILAWLICAYQALNRDSSKGYDIIGKGAIAWRSWFDTLPGSIKKEDIVLFHRVAGFLELYYKKMERWQDCLAVTEKACQVYRYYEAWPKVVSSLRTSIQCCYKSGQNNRALEFQSEILSNVPYEDSPPGFKVQQMIDVLLMRISHGQISPAKIMLEELKSSDESERLSDIIDGAQCDIYYHEEQYMDALPYYCKLWEKTVKMSQPDQKEQLKQRLMNIAVEVGIKCFNDCFDSIVPLDVERPDFQLQH